ncbi:MAG: hypothetical protein ACYS8Z_12725 [Planctomycetota bacterium]
MQCPKCEKEISTLHIDDYILDDAKIVLKELAKVEGNSVTILIEDVQLNVGLRDLISTCPECHDYKLIYKHVKKDYDLKWELEEDSAGEQQGSALE